MPPSAGGWQLSLVFSGSKCLGYHLELIDEWLQGRRRATVYNLLELVRTGSGWFPAVGWCVIVSCWLPAGGNDTKMQVVERCKKQWDHNAPRFAQQLTLLLNGR